MKLNTLIRLPDGRTGTVCYNNLDGVGGVWGVHQFEMPAGGFGDLPEPDFMLREKSIEQYLRTRGGHKDGMECVGQDYEVVTTDEAQAERVLAGEG